MVLDPGCNLVCTGELEKLPRLECILVVVHCFLCLGSIHETSKNKKPIKITKVWVATTIVAINLGVGMGIDRGS